MLTVVLLTVVVVETVICIVCLRLYTKSKNNNINNEHLEKEIVYEPVKVPVPIVNSNIENVEIDTELIKKIVRELKSPLSLVVAPLREVLCDESVNNELATKIKLAYTNSLEIESGCDVLYEIGNNENYSDKLNVSQYNMSTIIKDGVSKLQEIMNARGITLKIENNDRIMNSWIDRQKIDFVIKNIVYNSIKQHQNSGVIKINLSNKVVNDSVRYCVITITDEAMLCYHSNISHSLIEHIINAHGGKVLFENVQGEGNRTVISILMGKSHLENRPNISFVDANIDGSAISSNSSLPNFNKVDDRTVAAIVQETAHIIEKSKIENISQQAKTVNINSENINDSDDDVLKISMINNESVDGQKKKLLVVDDNKDILTYLRVIFSSTYTVVYARNGQEGVDFALSEMPDLILCDVMMPIKDGFECCKELKENLKTCHIPIILLTARVEDEDIIKGIKMGADDYIFKPFNPEILRVKVKNLIKNRSELKKTYMQLLMIPGDRFDAVKGNNSTNVEDNFIKMISELIENNIHESDFGVRKLSEMLNMSQPTLYRKVKQSTGFTIIELIRGVRLKRAAMLLRERQLTVQEVSEKVGYSDVPTFRKNFVDFFDVTPSNYASQSPRPE